MISSSSSSRSQHKRQRLSSFGSSAFATCILLKWAWGSLSAPDVQQLALACKLSGNTESEVDELASIGNYGLNDKQHRDLMLKFSGRLLTPQSRLINLPYTDVKGDANFCLHTQVPIILPSDWLRTLMTNPDLSFEKEACFGVSELFNQFWNKCDLNDPKLVGHQILNTPNFRHKAIPLLLHGDAAEFERYDSLFTISMSGLLKDGQTLDTNLLITSWAKSDAWCGPGGSFETLWAWISWDLQALAQNRYPDTDPFGQPLSSEFDDISGQSVLPDGFAAFLYGIQGDMDFFYDLGMPHFAQELPKPCCGWCSGTKTDVRPWFDFRTDAAWRNSMPQKQADWSEHVHIMQRTPGVHHHSFLCDWLHTVDLGVSAHFIANVIYDITYNKLSHMSRLSAVAEVREIVLQPVVHGSTLSQFDLGNFTNPKKHLATYPILCHMKAAHVRGLVPHAVSLALKYHNTTSNHDRHVVRAARALDRVYAIMHSSPMFIPADVYGQFLDAATQFLLSYSWLASEAHRENKKRWSIVPKHHYFAHLVEQARFCNPRFVWCYGSEDFVGRASCLAQSCTRGSPGPLVIQKMLAKYRIAKHLMWISLLEKTL
jgi:hypothetical protein